MAAPDSPAMAQGERASSRRVDAGPFREAARECRASRLVGQAGGRTLRAPSPIRVTPGGRARGTTGGWPRARRAGSRRARSRSARPPTATVRSPRGAGRAAGRGRGRRDARAASRGRGRPAPGSARRARAAPPWRLRLAIVGVAGGHCGTGESSQRSDGVSITPSCDFGRRGRRSSTATGGIAGGRRVAGQVEQAVAQRDRDQLRARPRAGLGHRVAHVRADGVRREWSIGADLAAHVAERDEVDDLALARGQGGGRVAGVDVALGVRVERRPRGRARARRRAAARIAKSTTVVEPSGRRMRPVAERLAGERPARATPRRRAPRPGRRAGGRTAADERLGRPRADPPPASFTATMRPVEVDDRSSGSRSAGTRSRRPGS